MLEAIRTGILGAVIACLLCVLYGEFRLVNIAGAAWVCLGGWVYVAVGGRGIVPLGPHGAIACCLFVAILGGFQTAVIIKLRHRLWEHPTLYLFVALAVHLSLLSGAGNLIPEFPGSVIPLPPAFHSFAATIYLSAVFLVVATSSVVFLRSRFFAGQVVRFRTQSPHDGKVWLFIALLQVVQLLGLLLVGALSTFVHMGQFGAMNLLMVTTTLGVIAAAGKPIRASLFAFGLGWGVLMLKRLPILADMAVPTAIALFLIVFVLVKRPLAPLVLFPSNTWLSPLNESKKTVIMRHAWIVIAFVLALLVWQLALRWSISRLTDVSLMMAYGLVAYVGIRSCGIVTASWPVIGGCFIYGIIHLSRSASVSSVSLFMAFSVVVFAYLWFLRASPPAIGLLVDLAVIVALYYFIRGSNALSGAENTLSVPIGDFHDGRERNSVFLIWIVASALIATVVWLQSAPRGRLLLLSASDPLHAIRNGVPVRPMMLGALAVLVLLASTVRGIQVFSIGSISPDTIDPIFGIACLFIGYTMAAGDALRSFLIAGFLIAFVPELIGIQGDWRNCWLAILIMLAISREAFYFVWRRSN